MNEPAGHETLGALVDAAVHIETDESIDALVEDDLERRCNERFPYPPPDGWYPSQTQQQTW